MKPIDICRERGISTAEFIRVMNEAFPKYCKASNSMCNRGDEYGVSLSHKALKYLAGTSSKRPNRVKPNQFTFRLDDTEREEFEKAKFKNGHTTQEAVERAVIYYIRLSHVGYPGCVDLD